MRADPDDAGLLSPAETSLLIDRYELAMAASYHRRGMNDAGRVRAVRARAAAAPQVAAGRRPRPGAHAGRARCGSATRSSPTSRRSGSSRPFLDYLAGFRFSGDVDAMPEGTIVFANEPLVRVTAPRIEGQLLETLLLNQLNFQTAIATKAARIVLAIGGGTAGPRRPADRLLPAPRPRRGRRDEGGALRRDRGRRRHVQRGRRDALRAARRSARWPTPT